MTKWCSLLRQDDGKEAALAKNIQAAQQRVHESLLDDLNSKAALDCLLDLIKDTNKYLAERQGNAQGQHTHLSLISIVYRYIALQEESEARYSSLQYYLVDMAAMSCIACKHSWCRRKLAVKISSALLIVFTASDACCFSTYSVATVRSGSAFRVCMSVSAMHMERSSQYACIRIHALPQACRST